MRCAAARDALIDLLHLRPVLERGLRYVSTGELRKALLARAMVKSPAILLLDEATLSLDAGHRRLLLDAIDHVVGRYRCQLLFVSHTPGEVPSCINQLLRFTPAAGGSRVTVRDYPGWC